MKKVRLFIALACTALFFLPAKAERVPVEKAEQVARTYARVTPRLAARRDFRLSRTVSKALRRNRPAAQGVAQSAAPQEEPLYYVFTLNGDAGFIIVSGDDAAKPVLGYADEGTFDESNPNLAYWMATLAQEIAEAIENDAAQEPEIKATWDAFESGNLSAVRQASAGYVDPLVKTKWNQNAPYSNLCPSRYYTGCVATAMAQIMKYHEYPSARTVTIPAYTTTTNRFAVPAMPAATYDWNNMTNTYTGTATGVTADAVATLMYHCGASVKMDYDSEGSGAYSADVVQALKTYFNYDAGIAHYSRNYYTYAEWVALLKAEISAARPVYYAGSGSGGHAFVCDGYDADGLFHFNWGWGGSSDGYFEVSALNPRSIGIGGGSGGYNRNQAIITGIRPNQGGSSSQPAMRIGVASVSASRSSLNNLTTSFHVTATNFTNTGASTITAAYIGVMLCTRDDALISYKTTQQTFSGFIPTTYYSSRTLTTNYTLPSDLSAGTYKLYPAYSASSGTPVLIPGVNGNRYLTVVVGSDKRVTLTSDLVKPELTVNALTPVGALYQNRPGIFEASITNSGAADYHSGLRIQLSSQTVSTEPVVIPSGATKTVAFAGTVTLAPGANYALSLWYDPSNTPAGTPTAQLGSAVSPIQVKATPTESASLTLASTPSFRDGSAAVPQHSPNLTVELKNTGGAYIGEVQVRVYPYNSTSGWLGDFGSVYVSLGKNETKRILYNHSLDFLTPGQQYDAYVYAGAYLYPKFTFTLTAYSADATLKGLAVEDAQTHESFALTPAFQPDVKQYVVTVNNTTAAVSITGDPNNRRATVANIENRTLDIGRQNVFDLNVTAEDGATAQTYTVAIVQGAPPVPGNAGAITITEVATQRLTLNWTKATDDASAGASLKYYVYRSASANISTPQACKENGTLLNVNGTADIAAYAVTGLAPRATYYFNVVAEDEAGNVAAYAMASATTKAMLSGLTVEGLPLVPPFDPDVTNYAVTLPCGINSFAVAPALNDGSTAAYLADGVAVALPVPFPAPGITTLVVRVTAGDGTLVQDYTIAVTRPFDASIIRTYWNDVLAVNLNTATNGGYTFTGIQWTKNGQPIANETAPYLYIITPPSTADRYSVLLTTDGQTLPVCREVQITLAAAPPASLQAYPNPAHYTVTVENPQWETATQTDLISLSGNVVRSYPSARLQTLNVSGLPVGLYILRAGALTAKIVIE
jgi:hypothetical protein